MSATRRNDLALIGIVLLAGGIAVLATGTAWTARAAVVGGLWSAALAAFATARRL